MNCEDVKGVSGGRTFSNTPKVFTPFDNSPIGSLHILGRTDDGKWNRLGQYAGVVGTLIVSLNRRGIDTNTLSLNDISNLMDDK